MTTSISSTTPHPVYFVSRPDGTMTPLIAVDELPDSVSILGVSVTLTPDQTFGMKCLGCIPRAEGKYVVENTLANHHNSPGHTSSASDDTLDAKTGVSVQPLSNCNGNQPTVNGSNASTVNPIEQWRQEIRPEDSPSEIVPRRRTPKTRAAPSEATTEEHAPYNPETPGVYRKKVYCTHWLRTGECDFIQQGCAFKHQMPDFDTLALLGFRLYPRWWREAYHPGKTNEPGFPLAPVYQRAQAIADHLGSTNQGPYGYGRMGPSSVTGGNFRARFPSRGAFRGGYNGNGRTTPRIQPAQNPWIGTPLLGPSRAASSIEFFDAQSQLASQAGPQDNHDQAGEPQMHDSRITEVSDESFRMGEVSPTKTELALPPPANPLLSAIVPVTRGFPVILRRSTPQAGTNVPPQGSNELTLINNATTVSQIPTLQPTAFTAQAIMERDPAVLSATGPRPLNDGVPQLPQPTIHRRFVAPDANHVPTPNEGVTTPPGNGQPANVNSPRMPVSVFRRSSHNHAQYNARRGGGIGPATRYISNPFAPYANGVRNTTRSGDESNQNHSSQVDGPNDAETKENKSASDLMDLRSQV